MTDWDYEGLRHVLKSELPPLLALAVAWVVWLVIT